MRRHALPILVAASALLVTACGGSTVDTAGLTRVQISSYQSLPPPYGSRQATLTSPSSLTAFQQAIAQDRIGMSGSSTVSTGCTGGIQYTVMHHRVLGVAGEKQHLGLRTALAHMVGQLSAAHLRHHHVGKQQIDATAVCLADLQGLRAARRGQNRIAKLLQNPHCQIANRLFVLHYQDGLAAAPPGRRRIASLGVRERFEDAWEIQFEGGPLPRLAIDPDVSAGLFHNAVHGSQAQTGPFALFFGRKKRLEDVAPRLRIHAVSVVAHCDHGEFARLHAHMRAGVILIQHNIRGLDCQVPANGHGIAGVHRQIHDGLLHVARIGFDIAHADTEVENQLDIFANQPLQHFLRLDQHRIDVDHARLHDLAPAERQ